MKVDLSKLNAETKFNKRGEAMTIVEVPSESNPDKMYRVDIINQRCSCPAWKFRRGHDKLCKHLLALGFTQRKPEPAPSFVKNLALGELVAGVEYL